MTLEEIETFLAVVEQGNISAAAQYLFVTQGTVSNRIKSLENELNDQLIIRKKGQKNIDLTPFGREFIPIAQQWTALWKDTQLLHQCAQRRHLRIGSIDVINNYTFLPLYQEFIQSHPQIQLIPFFYFYAGLSDGWMSKYYAAIGMVCVGISMYVTEEGEKLIERFNPRTW